MNAITRFFSRIFSFIRRRKWTSAIIVVVLLLVGSAFAKITSPKQPEYITAVATQGDLQQTVEAVGTVISEKDLSLQFRSSGIVGDVSVKEGDKVQAGQRLAALRAGSLGASVASAAARVQEMEASLSLLEAGSRPEDIAITQADLDNKKAALALARQSLANAEESVKTSQAKLDALQTQSDVSMSGEISQVGSIVSQKVSISISAISATQDVFANSDLQDVIVKGKAGDYQDLQIQMTRARDALAAIPMSGTGPSDYNTAIALLQSARSAVQQTASVLDRAYDLVSSLTPNGYLTVTAQTAYKSSIATQRSSVQTALKDIDSSMSDLQNLPASVQTQIATEQANLQNAKGARDKASADIQTYQTSVQINEAQLQLKIAPARPQDIAAAKARLNQARADLARASADYGDTFITAPTSGIVTQVNVKVGEASPAGTAIQMIGAEPYRIEMFASEVDIPKVILAQSGSIELDAFRGTNFALRVSEIDPASTDKDGVSKYRVKLDFLYPHDNIKIGMTGDTTIVTGERSNVVTVPQRAVLEKGGHNIVRVLKDNTVEERSVETGMEGNGDIEVTGVGSGETVVVLQK